MPITTSNETYMTSRQAAQLLGVSLRTVQLWVEKGVLRAWKTAGGHRRIVIHSVNELLRQQRSALEDYQPNDKLRVVVVEDEAVQLEAYRLKFSEWGLPIELITAMDGYKGLLEVGRSRPDLVIADLSMPGMDGLQMIRAINESPTLRHTKIIAVTGLSKADIRARGGLPEDVQVYEKPVPFIEIEALLRSKLSLIPAKPENPAS